MAGLDVGDEIRQIDGRRVASPEDVHAALSASAAGRHHRRSTFVDRGGIEKKTSVTLGEDPQLELVPRRNDRAALTPAQKTFRDRWLN